MKDEEPRWVDKAHQMTGVSKEELKRMSWSKVERLLGIELEEPPKEVKLLIRGGYFAMRKRWITKKEVDSLHMEINKLMKKYGIPP